MYSAKILGTKYAASIEQDHGQWYVRIKLNDNVEAQQVLPQMTQGAIEKKLNAVLRDVNVILNELQFNMLVSNLIKQFPHLMEDDIRHSSTSSGQSGAEANKIHELEEMLKKLQQTIDTLSSRIERLEKLLT